MIEPVSKLNSLITGKITGKIENFGLSVPTSCGWLAAESRCFQQIHCDSEQGNFRCLTGKLRGSNREIGNREIARAVHSRNRYDCAPKILARVASKIESAGVLSKRRAGDLVRIDTIGKISE
jgi:hypothetical protein